jgi:putative transposase
MTSYSDNKVTKFGSNCRAKLGKVCKEIDIIKSRIDKRGYYVNVDNEKQEHKLNANSIRNLKKALHRKIQYIKDLKNELHNQVANYLTKHYGKIIITPFKTQEMASNLTHKVARAMYNLSFYQFRMKLTSKSNERNCILDVKPEPYTSKTCTKCGNIKYSLGSQKLYECEKCGLKIQRDYNGARNIMLRNNF